MSLLKRLLLTNPVLDFGGNCLRRSHEIAGPAQTEYQVQITVHYGEGVYTAGVLSIVIQASCVLNDGTTLLATRPDGTVYRSSDDGENFVYLSTLPDVDGTARYMFCASNGYVYVLYDRFAVAKGRIYRSIDAGANWTTECEAEVNAESFWHMCEDASGNLYASGYSSEAPPTSGHAKVWKSTNDGDTWVNIHNFGADYRHCHAIGVNPHNGWLYVIVGDAGVVVGDEAGIFRSKDSGASWTRIYGGATGDPFLKAGLAFTGEDDDVYVGSESAATVCRGDDTGVAAIAFPVIWTAGAGYTGQVLYMVKTSDGRLVLATHAPTVGQRSFIAISDSTNWAGTYTYLESIVSSGAWRDFYSPLIDKFSDNRIGLSGKNVAGVRVNGVRIYFTTGLDDDVYLNGKCQTDFDDVRFRQGVTELDYWMEEKVDSDYAVFWVEVQTIPADPVIYVYYGNDDVTTTSDGDATFLFFDDFPGVALNLTKWNAPIGGSYSVAGSLLTITQIAASRCSVRSVNNFGYPLAIHHRARTSDQNSAWGMDDDTGTNRHLHLRVLLAAIVRVRLQNKKLGVATETTYIWDDFANLHTFSNAWESDEVKYYRDGVLEATHNANIPLVDLYVKMFSPNQDDEDAIFDWVFIRKYVDPEPTHGDWGPEEQVVWPF